jgi:hypothetical protein
LPSQADLDFGLVKTWLCECGFRLGDCGKVQDWKAAEVAQTLQDVLSKGLQRSGDFSFVINHLSYVI